jgi:ketosteroid isomerase-like protein
MRAPAIILTVGLAVMAFPLPAQQFGPQPDTTTQREILQLREAAWRTWFANDRTGFERVVPDELVALGWDGGPWDDRARTVAQMEAFAETGMTLTTLEFPRNVFQQYGDVVLLYTRFRLVLSDRDGTPHETTGRGTEVFVRRGGRWIHTGWHLDTVGGEERAPGPG